VEIHVSRDNTCTGEQIFQIVTGGWLTSATGLDIYTGGASLNIHTRSLNFANYGQPGYEGDEYEVWTSLQVKCTSITERYHPGVNCTGVLSGHVSFGKWVVTVPSGTPASLRWGGSA
jgi:hypothetical protein